MKTALQQQLIQGLRKVVRALASARNLFIASHQYPTPVHSVHVPGSHHSHPSYSSSYYYPASPKTLQPFGLRSTAPIAAT
ncbi:MAG: hypothetical protein HYZ45_05185 [Burkholderiales bacterium]|nr:hypothetical protein [Burkholderiales bacterium]